MLEETLGEFSDYTPGVSDIDFRTLDASPSTPVGVSDLDGSTIGASTPVGVSDLDGSTIGPTSNSTCDDRASVEFNRLNSKRRKHDNFARLAHLSRKYYPRVVVEDRPRDLERDSSALRIKNIGCSGLAARARS